MQPVWQRLADRAAAIGRPVPQRATTTDAGLRLRSKRTGRRTVKPIYSDSNLVIFIVPRRSQEVRLLSRAQSPTEARPWLDDRRRLGVRVKRIVLRGADELREIPVDHPDLTRGWWAVERDGQVMSRWTDGEAVLPLPAMQRHRHAGDPSGRLDDLRRGRCARGRDRAARCLTNLHEGTGGAGAQPALFIWPLPRSGPVAVLARGDGCQCVLDVQRQSVDQPICSKPRKAGSAATPASPRAEAANSTRWNEPDRKVLSRAFQSMPPWWPGGAASNSAAPVDEKIISGSSRPSVALTSRMSASSR